MVASTGALSSADASSSGTSSSSSSTTGFGPPCNTPSPCQTGQSCCFNKTDNIDLCDDNCSSGYLELHCHDEEDCGGLACCTKYANGGLGALIGTECDATCVGMDSGQACDPTEASACNCVELLGQYFQSGSPPPPYDHYGECQ